MKAFTKENFEKFIASESNDDKDTCYSSSQDRAAVVFDHFLKWLEVVNTPKIMFPVRQRNSTSRVVEDARGKKVATAPNPGAAAVLVQQLNAGHRPNSSVTDEKPSAAKCGTEDDEDWEDDEELGPIAGSSPSPKPNPGAKASRVRSKARKTATRSGEDK